MGEIFIEGLPFSIDIEGDAPTKDEAQRIMKIVDRLDEIQSGAGQDTIKMLEDGPLSGLYSDEKIEELSDKLGIDFEQKRNAINLLNDLGFIEKQELLPLEQFGISRTDAAIAGSMVGSAQGFREMFDIKSQADLKKLYKNVALFNPKNLAVAGGKMLFGGIFGDIGGRAAYDVANFILSGDKDTLQFLNTLDADTKEAIFYESLGLIFPETLAAIYRNVFSGVGFIKPDQLTKKAVESAQRLGIDLNFGQIVRFAPLARALSPLPYIGGGVRKTLATQAGKLNEAFQKFTELYAPISTFSKNGVDIFAKVDARFKANKRVLNRLWEKAYNSHAMLKDKNVFRADDLNKFFTNLLEGNVINKFKNLPTNKDGIIETYETIQKSGFFENAGLARIQGEGLKDLIDTMRRYQIDVNKNGGRVSYETIRNFNDEISTLFKDLTEGDKPFKSQFALILTQFRTANDQLLENLDKNLIKELIPEDMLPNILTSHKDANEFTKRLLDLYEGPSGNIFGTYVKNLFKPGFIKDKKARDQILNTLMNVRSPDMLKDLQKIMGPNNFKAYANEWMSDKFAKAAVTEGDAVATRLDYDPQKLNQAFGFDIRSKTDFTEELFKILGVNNQRLKDLITSGAFLQNVKIGNPSSFLQRRFQLTGMNNILGTALAGGAAYGGSNALIGDEDDGILAKGIKGLAGLFIMRYGISKVFANPKLAKKIIDVYDPNRALNFNIKLDLFRGLFDLHHQEDPESISQSVEIMNQARETLVDSVSDAELDAFDELLNTLKSQADIFEKGQTLEEEEQQMEKLREDPEEVIEEDIIIPEEKPEQDDVSFNIPSPNINMNMANVVPPISSAQLDPALVQRLSSVGLPLFANEGGIATLMNKPQQMVA
jgi:hypothetical protein